MAVPNKKHASQPCVIPGGFTVLDIKFTKNSPAAHQLFVKEHKVRLEKTSSRPLDRTLFVLNIPPYCTEDVITRLFSQFGAIQSVELKDKPGHPEPTEQKLSKYFTTKQKQGFSVGYIVYTKPSGVTAAKTHPQNVPLIVSTEDHPVRTGLHKWIHQYSQSFVQPDTLQQAVDYFMSDYDRRKEEDAERKKKEAEQQEEDEEGWVKVTKGAKGTKVRPHSEAADKRALEKEGKKTKRKELLRFYSWQHRESQREHIAELRKKFEEDKQKIALLRAQRKFKPY
ncbi:ribosomal RNA-processing protein 7 homolog A [Clupea harengus]|uniref:Ribosomal RNA-processing protein 7 homolog A n=1 Tax=Clupea harengus TaxID=7950 RepID=A0A6P3VU19_CLUHA|nr:ribosomal RNA-processing protein 7 homolog A [Clupea harengus]